MESKFRNVNGEVITMKDLFEGYWIRTKNGETRGLYNILPRKCDECGFPAMEIRERDFERQIVKLRCFWCDSVKELCLICGEIAPNLDGHHH